MANPRFSVIADFILRMPHTFPLSFSSGPPLFPGSIGIAIWISDWLSISLMPEIIPRTMLNSRPCGLPMAMTSDPCSEICVLSTCNGFRSFAFIFRMARSNLRSDAKICSTLYSFPSSKRTFINLDSPIT